MDFSFNPANKAAKMAMGADAYSSSDSDSDDEVRMPSTDPMAGEFGEFQPRKRRRTGRDTKENAALGVFGSDSDDDRHTGRHGKKHKALRQQGMSFVSSATDAKRDADGGDDNHDDDDDDDDNGDDNEDEESEEDGHFGLGSASAPQGMAGQEDDDYDDYDDETPAGAGLGLGASANTDNTQPGMGFMPAAFRSSVKSKSRQVPSFRPPASFDTPTGLGQGFVPSSAYEPTLRANDEASKKPAIVARPSAFSSKTAGRGGAPNGSMFNSKSFGARMMAKMGYVEGQGLGVAGQGRNMIIEANLRPQGVGVGAVKEKTEAERQQEKRQARLRGETVVSSDDEETKVKKAAAERRRKAKLGGSGTTTNSGVSTPKRPKKKYMTMDEVKRAAPGLHIPDAFTPILDMTGPGKKLLTSSSGLMTPGSGPATPGATADETTEDAESRKLARRAQTDFMAILEEWQSLQNRKAYAELQAEQLRQELAELDVSHQGHKTMTEAFNQLSLQNVDGQDSWRHQWDQTIAQLKVAADAIPASSLSDMKSALADISIAAIHPLFKRAMDAWEPLRENHLHLVEGLLSIQGLLGIGPDGVAAKKALGDDTKHDVLYRRPKNKKPTATPYETMMYRLWLPAVSAAVREWDVVHDTDSMLSLFETWLPVLPDFVRAQLLEHDIVRRLDGAVAKWEPKRRRHHGSQNQNLPHLWLFPWLIHLPARHLDPAGADGLVSEVKRKFRQLIDVWEFYRGVVPGLQQWKTVLRPASSLISTTSTTASSSSSSRSADQWRPLVMSHVLPSMGRYVRSQFRVDPHDQGPYLEVITGEFQWLDLLAPELVGEVMVSALFPMWHETLYHLLTTTGRNALTLEQIGQWLEWWMTEVFPPKVQRLPSVSAEFERGLIMVNEALDLCRDGPYDADRVRALLAPPTKGPAYRGSTNHHGGSSSSHHHHHQHHQHGRHHHSSRRHEDKDKTAAASTPARADKQPEDVSIRSYVEEWCENNDIQFIPERKKVHAEGRPLYRLTSRGDGRGGVLAYFKGVRLYAETKKGPLEIRVDRDEDWTKLQALAQ